MANDTPDADPKLTKRVIHNARAKQANKVSALLGRLNDAANGKVSMNTAQVAAAKLFLSKLIPDEQRVETVETSAPRSREQILADIRALAKAQPDLFEEAFAKPQLKAVD